MEDSPRRGRLCVAVEVAARPCSAGLVTLSHSPGHLLLRSQLARAIVPHDQATSSTNFSLFSPVCLVATFDILLHFSSSTEIQLQYLRAPPLQQAPIGSRHHAPSSSSIRHVPIARHIGPLSCPHQRLVATIFHESTPSASVCVAELREREGLTLIVTCCSRCLTPTDRTDRTPNHRQFKFITRDGSRIARVDLAVAKPVLAKNRLQYHLFVPIKVSNGD